LSIEPETCTAACGEDAWAHICTKSCNTRSETTQKLRVQRPTDQFSRHLILPVSGAFLNYGKRSTVMIEMAVDRVNSDGQTHTVMHGTDTQTHIHTCTHTHTRTHTHTHTNTHTNTHTHSHTHIYTHTQTNAHTHAYKCRLTHSHTHKSLSTIHKSIS
jgi:hypothetical protein